MVVAVIIHRIVHLKLAHFIVYESYLNTADQNKKYNQGQCQGG